MVIVRADKGNSGELVLAAEHRIRCIKQEER